MFLLIVFAPCFSHAAVLCLEQDFQRSFQHQKDVVKKAKEKQKKGQSVLEEIAFLKSKADELRTSHLLLYEKFKAREDEIKGLGAKAINRHKEMMETYAATVEEYLSMIGSLPPGGKVKPEDLDLLNEFLDKHVHKRKLPLLGALPYRHLNYPSREPNAGPSIKPAYKGGNRTVSPDDTKSTESIPISKEIAEFAQSLNWQPVAIYEYLKANIDTEWAWGCRKSVEETLRQKSGTPCEQSALFAAALRSAGFPSRIVRGTIEFPSLEQVKNLTGIDDPSKIAEFFEKAGIPYKPIIAGGKITNFQIEHIWVESLIPYSNYRGAIIDEHGKTWLGLDTSIKVTGYTYNAPLDILKELSFDGLRDEYLEAVRTETPIEYMKTYIETYLNQNHPGMTYNDLLQTKMLIPEVMNILPASMQYDQISVTHEYTDIPDDLRHKVKFRASDTNNNELFSISIDSLQLSNRKITLSYEPETVEDQQIIDSYGGLDNTPAYLVRLRPVLKVDGNIVVAGKDGLPAGTDYNLNIELISPNGTERITSTQITANLTAIGIVSQKALDPQQTAISEEDDAETILFKEANRYIDRWNHAEDELSSLMQLSFTRPIPTVTTIGGVIDVTYLLDIPHGYEWKGVYCDASLRSASVVPGGKVQDASERQKQFMQLSALQGSILENRIFEDDFQVESISTAKMMQVARNTQPATEILTIDKTNIDTILPTLAFDDNIKEDITNAVNQNYTIRIPNSAITYEDWAGIGYIKENPVNGEAGYMLVGMIAGGMTAWGTDKWPAYYLDKLKNPFSEQANYDPASAHYIQKIAGTDLQFKEVGWVLDQPLTVKVTDKEGRPVNGAEVVFTVKAGGGKLISPVLKIEQDTVTIKTDKTGMGKVSYRLGYETKANPAYFTFSSDDKYYTKVGENIISATLGISGVSTPKPFTEYGKPGKPHHMKQTYGDGKWGHILSFAGFVSVVVEDKYNNPIANLPIDFQSLEAIQNKEDPNCAIFYKDPRNALLTTTDNPCVKKAPTYYECPDAKPTLEKVLTDSFGSAAAEVILGGSADAIYPIKATCTSGNQSCIDPATGNPFTTTFNRYSYYHDDCNDQDAPKGQLVITYTYPADYSGNNIDAGKVGTTIPVTAKMYYLKEGEKEITESLKCADNTSLTCTKIVGTREYSVTTDFISSSLTFDGQPGTPQGDGIYTGQHILTAGLNDISVNGTATVGIRKSANNCAGGCKIIEASPETQTANATLKVYGVGITLNTPGRVFIDEDGYSLNDLRIDYTIAPSDYKPLSAALVVYKGAEMIDYKPLDNNSTGDITLAEGFQFDFNILYSVQIVLNYESGVEMRSEPKTLAVGKYKIIAYDDPNKTMQGVVTDGAARIKLQLNVKHNREAFAGLNWQLIDPDMIDYLPPASVRGTLLNGDQPVETLPVVFNAESIAEAVYRAPETFVRWETLEVSNDKERPERLIQPTVDITAYFKNKKDPFTPIRLKRTPVVLVHGLWGNRFVWNEFILKFNAKKIYDIFPIDYSEAGQVSSITLHAKSLRSYINDQIKKMATDYGFAANKVDIVAHSLGGLLTREYCFDYKQACQNKVRRLITIATPHFGSELADLLLVYRDDRDNFPNPFTFTFPFFRCQKRVDIFVKGSDFYDVKPHPIIPSKLAGGGAIDDLATGTLPAFMPSDAKTYMGRWADLPPFSGSLSAHAIIGQTPSDKVAIESEISDLWNKVLLPCGFGRDNLFGSEAELNDRIVKQSSQKGGLLNDKITIFDETDHYTVRNDQNTVDRVKILLDEPIGSEKFSK